MYIYIVFFLIMIVCWLLSKSKYYNRQIVFERYDNLQCGQITKRRFFSKYFLEIFIFFIFFVLLVFRDFSVGVDLKYYQNFYLSVGSGKNIYDYELLYFFVNFLCKIMGLGFRWVLILEAFLFCFSVWSLIHKYSKDKILSLIIIFSVGYFAFACCLIRQMYAMAFILLATKKLFDDENSTCIGYILIASLFHKSSIVFIVAPLLYRLKAKYVYFIILIIVNVIIAFFGGTIINFIGDTFNLSYFKNYEGGQHEISLMTWFTLIVQVVGLICLFLYAKKMELLDDKANKFYFWNLVLFVEIRYIANILHQVFITRLIVYYLLFLSLLMPNLLNSLKNKKIINMVNILMFVCLFVYMFEQYYINDYYGITPYLVG